MAIPTELTGSLGRWQGTNRLQDPHTNAPDDSTATAAVAAVVDGRFLRIDYTWAYHGTPQEGTLLLGGPAGQPVTAVWADSWHMGHDAMACRGGVDASGRLTLRGSYPAPPGPDWGWRIDLAVSRDGPPTLTLVMFNVTPDGQEDLAVEATLARCA